jgi:hypothetical protein
VWDNQKEPTVAKMNVLRSRDTFTVRQILGSWGLQNRPNLISTKLPYTNLSTNRNNAFRKYSSPQATKISWNDKDSAGEISGYHGCVVTPYGLVNIYRRFVVACFFHFQGPADQLSSIGIPNLEDETSVCVSPHAVTSHIPKSFRSVLLPHHENWERERTFDVFLVSFSCTQNNLSKIMRFIISWIHSPVSS